MQERTTHMLCLAILAGLAGCHASKSAPSVGDRLPVVSSKSVALPGAVDAADAPGSPAVAEPRADNLVEYRDTAHGVSFGYPSVWRPAQLGNTDLGQPEFAQVAPKPLITQVFSSKGTPYENTVLDSLGFSYTVQPHTTAAACAAIPGKALQNSGTGSSAVYNGRRYTENSGGDASTCHRLAATVDTTLVGSTCHIFERDTATTCPFVKTNTEPRPLTAAEQAALGRHLDAVMQSVQIGS